MFVTPVGINFILPAAGKGWGLSAINRGMTMQGRGTEGTRLIFGAGWPCIQPCIHIRMDGGKGQAFLIQRCCDAGQRGSRRR